MKNKWQHVTTFVDVFENDFFRRMVNMDFFVILKAVLAFVFVLGLLFVTLWGLKFLQTKIPSCKSFKKLSQKQRIEVLEIKKISAKNTLFLLRKDDKEYFVLSSGEQNLLLDVEKIKLEAVNRDEM